MKDIKDNIELSEDINENIRVRINMSMSKELVDFYQEMADSMGIARSTCMVIGLKTYMDQQKMLRLTNQLPK